MNYKVQELEWGCSLPNLIMETSNSSQAGNSTICMFSFSMKVFSLFIIVSMLSSGFRITSQVKFLSGTVNVTLKGIVEGGGR